MTTTRRRALLALGAAGLSPSGRAAPQPSATPLAQHEPIAQLHAGGPSGLLGVGVSGVLWSLAFGGEAGGE